MWTWFNCYLSGRHDYGVWCEPGAIFLRCIHCGKRSGGWAISKLQPHVPATTKSEPRAPLDVTPEFTSPPTPMRTGPRVPPASASPRVLPFDRIAVR